MTILEEQVLMGCRGGQGKQVLTYLLTVSYTENGRDSLSHTVDMLKRIHGRLGTATLFLTPLQNAARALRWSMKVLKPKFRSLQELFFHLLLL